MANILPNDGSGVPIKFVTNDIRVLGEDAHGKDTLTTVKAIVDAMSRHVAEVDPHTQYIDANELLAALNSAISGLPTGDGPIIIQDAPLGYVMHTMDVSHEFGFLPKDGQLYLRSEYPEFWLWLRERAVYTTGLAADIIVPESLWEDNKCAFSPGPDCSWVAGAEAGIDEGLYFRMPLYDPCDVCPNEILPSAKIAVTRIVAAQYVQLPLITADIHNRAFTIIANANGVATCYVNPYPGNTIMGIALPLQSTSTEYYRTLTLIPLVNLNTWVIMGGCNTWADIASIPAGTTMIQLNKDASLEM